MQAAKRGRQRHLRYTFNLTEPRRLAYNCQTCRYSSSSLGGRVALITGGSRGIGLAIAKEFAQLGASVAVLSRTKDAVERAVEELPTEGSSRHIGLVCDVTDGAKIKESVKQVGERLGGVDILVNAAGITYNALLIKSEEEEIKRVINCNLVGPMLAAKAVLPYMLRKNRGCIINLGSVIGSLGNSGQAVYAATKSGLVGFTKSLASEYGSRGITANVVAPGFVDTDMTEDLKAAEDILAHIPLQRFGKPEEIARVASLLATSNYITGQVLIVDGGLSLFTALPSKK